MKKNISFLLLSFSICNFFSMQAGLHDYYSLCKKSLKNTAATLKNSYNDSIKPCLPYLGAMGICYLSHCVAEELGIYPALSYAGQKLWEFEDYPNGVISRKALGLFTIAYWYKFCKHYYDFDSIERRLSDAVIHDNDLKWAAWNIDDWQTAYSLQNNKQQVEEKLKRIIKNKDKKKEITTEISHEKQEIEKLIISVGAFSDFPEEFVNALVNGHNKKIEYNDSLLDSANAQKKAIAAAQHLKDCNIKLDDDYASPLVKNTKMNIISYVKSWLNPCTWTLAPWSAKAKKLCAKLVRFYGRLLVLEDIVKAHKVERSKEDRIKELGQNTSIKLTGDVNQVMED